MRVYGKRNGLMMTAEVPDGSMYLEVGSRDNGRGRGELQPIMFIDWGRRVYQRRNETSEQPFPEKYHREADIEWKPHEDWRAFADLENRKETP